MYTVVVLLLLYTVVVSSLFVCLPSVYSNMYVAYVASCISSTMEELHDLSL